MLRCTDNSLYTGITNDFEKRYASHFNKEKIAAKYTKSRQVHSVACLWTTETRSDALKLEIRIKKLSKKDKERLVLSPCDISAFFNDLADVYTPGDCPLI